MQDERFSEVQQSEQTYPNKISTCHSWHQHLLTTSILVFMGIFLLGGVWGEGCEMKLWVELGYSI